MHDRIGLGWRPQLSASILSNRHRIDVVEVIADDYFHTARRTLRALKTLAAQVPLVLHGVTLGLASAVPVAEERLAKMARLVEEIQPECWSEHLAFVRGGGYEIGHLAAPPCTSATIEGATANLARARAIVGVTPLVENVATLIDPPGNTYDEATWMTEILAAADCDLLLDLHNLYANAVNFHFDPQHFLAQVPSERIAAIHVAGGQWIGSATTASSRRLLDDHLHDVPEAVYDLLSEVGRRAPRPLTVILERDGRFPPFDRLLEQLERARYALARGRSQRAACWRAKAV